MSVIDTEIDSIHPQNSKVLTGGMAVLLRQFISIPANLAGVVFCSRLLHPTDYGLQAVLIPAITFATLFSDLGLTQALINHKHCQSPRSARIIRLCQLFGAIICAVLFALSSTLIGSWLKSAALPAMLPFCGLVGWLTATRNYQSIELQRHLAWTTLAKIELIEILIYNAALIASACILRSAWCFVIALCIRMTMGTIILKLVQSLNKALKSISTGEKVDLDIKNLLHFGVPLQLCNVFGILNSSANPVIVGHLVGSRGVGLNSWGDSVSSLPRLLMQPIPQFLFAVQSKRNREDNTDASGISAFAYGATLIIAIACLLYALGLDILLPFVFGSKWLAATVSAQLLIVANIVIVPNLIVSALITSGGHGKAYLTINVIGTVLIYACGLVLTHFLGFVGYALAWLLISQVMLFVLCWFASKHVSSNVRAIDSLFLQVVVIGGVFLYSFMKHGIAIEIATAICVTLLCCLIAWIYTRSFRRNEWVVFWNIITSAKNMVIKRKTV